MNDFHLFCFLNLVVIIFLIASILTPSIPRSNQKASMFLNSSITNLKYLIQILAILCLLLLISEIEIRLLWLVLMVVELLPSLTPLPGRGSHFAEPIVGNNRSISFPACWVNPHIVVRVRRLSYRHIV